MPPRTFSSRAIAYLKAAVPPDPTRPGVSVEGPDAPVLRDLNNGLLVSYVVDTGSQLEYIQQRHLAQDALSEDELHAAGLANLAARASGALRVAPHPNGQMFVALMGGTFEASLILLDQLWDEGFRRFVSGEYAVAIPARDLLAFCDASSPAGLRELRAACAAAKACGADHPLSDRLYRRRDGAWEVLAE